MKMNPDIFFENCDNAMDNEIPSDTTKTNSEMPDNSLELMDIFSLMDEIDTEPVKEVYTQKNQFPEDISVQENQDFNFIKKPNNVTIDNTIVAIKPQSVSALNECSSIKELVMAYFNKYGVSKNEIDFINYVNQAFSSMFPYCKKCDTYLKKLQYALIMGYGIGLTQEALENIGVSLKLRYSRLRLPRRLIGLRELNILQECTEDEFLFLRKYSLTEKSTEPLLSLYREKGDSCIKDIEDYLGNSHYFEKLLELSTFSGFKNNAFKAAVEQECLDDYEKSLKTKDTVTQILIEGKGYTKVKNSLKDIKSEELIHYANFHYLETIITLLDSGFTNMEVIEKYLKEENEIGEYLAKSYDMRMLKLLNKGYDIHYAVLTKLYIMHNLEVSAGEFEKYKENFFNMTLAYIRGELDSEDVMLHTVFLLKNENTDLAINKSIREAVYEYITKDLVVVNTSNLQNNFGAPETYQFISGNNSYVFNVYDFCNHLEEVNATICLFTNKRKNVKIYRVTSEICIIAFGNEGGTNFISEDRAYSCSLKNWCKGLYDKTKTYSIRDISKINGITVLQNYNKNFTTETSNYEVITEWLNNLYDSKCPYKADLVMDYLIKNPKSLSLLLSEYRQAGVATLSRVIDLEGFNQAFCFLRILTKGFCGIEPICSIKTQRRPNRSEIIIKSKRNGNKLCTFETIFSEMTFKLLMNELQNAKKVKISYINSIVIEFEE